MRRGRCLRDRAARDGIPLFVEVLNHCEGNQSRAAAMLGIRPPPA
ncbi:hypothetical protein C7E18_03425 [Stenotrophomonas maltophilia]|nr:hypothetical protein C7E18_03425 [Stenotrophomonas maltophilia]